MKSFLAIPRTMMGGRVRAPSHTRHDRLHVGISIRLAKWSSVRLLKTTIWGSGNGVKTYVDLRDRERCWVVESLSARLTKAGSK